MSHGWTVSQDDMAESQFCLADRSESSSKGWRKSNETGATGTETSSDSINGAKTLLVGVGGTSHTDDIEERDVAGEADLEELLDLTRATSTKDLLTNSSKSLLLPSSESSSSESPSTASIEKKSF